MHCLPSGDGPLLKTDEFSSLAWKRDFGDIDRDLGRADADTEAVDNTANDEHGDVLRGADDDASNDPDNGSDLIGGLACRVRTHVRIEQNVTPDSWCLRPRRSER
jgi:hypothetical protein